MEDKKKLFEELLKSDGIDPDSVSEDELTVFRNMLDSEQKRMKRLSWKYVGIVWMFALILLGICLSENFIEVLHIPFVIVALVVVTAILMVRLRYEPSHIRKILKSGRKVNKLYYLVHGRHKGLTVVGRKGGRLHIFWFRIFMIAVGLWVVMSLGGAGVYYLLCQRWIYSSAPLLYIFYCTVFSVSFVIFLMYTSFKTPLDELPEIKDKTGRSKQTKWQDIWRKIMGNRMVKFATAVVILMTLVVGIITLNSGSVAYAIEQTVEAFKNIHFVHVVRYDASGQVEDERWIEINPDGTQGRYRQDTAGKFLVIDNGQSRYIYRRDNDTVLLHDETGPKYTWISNLHDFFEDMTGNGSVSIKENIDYEGQKVHLIRWLKLNVECYIDPVTKLPIAIGRDKIYYDQPPEGIFDIPEIPKTATLIDKRKSNESFREPDWLKSEELAQKTFKEARIALSKGNYQDSIELFKKVFQLEGTSRNWAWFWLGQAYYKLGEYDPAIESYTKVMEMFAKHKMTAYETHYARGLAFRAKGDEKAAWDDFIIALPIMIDSLKEIEGAELFDYADDPLNKGTGLSEHQRFDNMVRRLELIAEEKTKLKPKSTKQEVIAYWENWWLKISE